MTTVRTPSPVEAGRAPGWIRRWFGVPSSTPGTRWLCRSTIASVGSVASVMTASLRQRSGHRSRRLPTSFSLQPDYPDHPSGAAVNTARRTHGFRESVIRGMTRLAREYGSINLAQGFPNFPAPELLKEAAARAIHDDINQYAITWGAQRLREAMARKYHAVVRARGGSGAGDHRHLRGHRGDDLDPARGGESGRRGDRLRAVLRELRPGHHPGRCQAGLRPARAGHAARSGPAGAGVLLPHPRHHRQHAEQSGGPGADPGRARGHPRLCASGTTPGHHGRDLRAHPLRGRPRPHGDVARACGTGPSPSAGRRRRSA